MSVRFINEMDLNLESEIYKPLTREEEFNLFEKYKNTKDVKIKNTIYNRNVKFVIKFIGRAKSLSNMREDLTSDVMFQVVSMGLLHCIDLFDHTKGIRFLTYASKSMSDQILKYKYRNSSITSGDSNLVRDYYSIMKLMNSNKDITIADISSITGFTESRIELAINYSNEYKHSISINYDSQNDDGKVMNSYNVLDTQFNVSANTLSDKVEYLELRDFLENVVFKDETIFPNNINGQKALGYIRDYYYGNKTHRLIADGVGKSHQSVQQTISLKLKKIYIKYQKHLEAYLSDI